MAENGTNMIRLNQNAWNGDEAVDLTFPAQWTIKVIGDQHLPVLSDMQIQQAIQNPIASPTIREMASGKGSAVILLDDLSRPTPAARLLPVVLNELLAGGIPAQRIVILVAGGTHTPLTNQEMSLKTGPDLPEGVAVLAHDCHNSLVNFGYTGRGTPIQINKKVVESDLKIGIGCIYPHPSAGFSGGSKILAPGAAGFDTVRSLHDNMRGSRDRAGSINTEFRDEIEEIVSRIGLDFIVNVTLNQQREISSIFAGDRIQALKRGVEYTKNTYAVKTHPEADITIVDMYPFDAEFQYAYDRGFWPLELAKPESTRVLLAGCPQGMGGHMLYPVSDLFYSRIKRQLQNFSMKEILSLGDRVRALNKMLGRRKLEVYLVSGELKEEQLKKTLPRGRVIQNWDAMLDILVTKHGASAGTIVAFYQCSPLMLPETAHT